MVHRDDCNGDISPRPTGLADREAIHAKLRAAPWSPIDGYFTRSILHCGITYVAVIRSCGDCGRVWSLPFYLNDEVWLSIAKKDELLCFGCTQTRLKRYIVTDDLKGEAGCGGTQDEWFEILKGRKNGN